MKTLTFQNEHRYAGDKVVVRIRLLRARVPTRVDMVLDTGAQISVLNRDFITHLGVGVESGEAVHVAVANGDMARAWIHPVDIDFRGQPMRIRAAFCPEWDMANLLGMRGFFDQMVVTFDNANQAVYY